MEPFDYDINKIYKEIEKFNRSQTDKLLAEIIKNYDFIVGTKECMNKLMEVLPADANIIYTPYVESPTSIYMVKKFDIMDYL